MISSLNLSSLRVARDQLGCPGELARAAAAIWGRADSINDVPAAEIAPSFIAAPKGWVHPADSV
jgi:hypothetical protein